MQFARVAVGLILTLNRKIHRAYYRVSEGNFTLDGLLGLICLVARLESWYRTNRPGGSRASCMVFGCRLVGYDMRPNPQCQELGMEYLSIDQLFQQSISLVCIVP